MAPDRILRGFELSASRVLSPRVLDLGTGLGGEEVEQPLHRTAERMRGVAAIEVEDADGSAAMEDRNAGNRRGADASEALARGVVGGRIR